jgi:hypothetical protein
MAGGRPSAVDAAWESMIVAEPPAAPGRQWARGGVSAGVAGDVSLAIDSTGTLYVAYADGGNGNRGTVMRFK